ncbi:MAG: LysM peptidoglycan-binding domain-containing protein [Chloroflexota bacterium]|nr:LysM peptidoglycan-binding domain-containing protein [Chloroflexota bacterium]
MTQCKPTLRRISVSFFLLLMLLPVLACSLSNVPPTAIPTNTPVPLVVPSVATLPPLVNPSIAPISSNPNCAFTPPTWVAYTVQVGDSIGALSLAVDTTIDEIVINNCLENADSLFADQVLYLPRLP